MPLVISDDVDPIEPADDSTSTDQPNELGRTCIVCGLDIPDSESGGMRRKKHAACAPSSTVTTKSTKTPSIDTLINQIGNLYRNLGMGVTFVPGLAADGMAVTVEAGTLAESWRPLIEKDPKIRKVWEKITTGSGWGTVAIVHVGLAMTIATNHGFTMPGMEPAAQQTQQPGEQGTN